MRFSLQDVKKQVQRRGGELYVGLHFLRQGEAQSEIERLIAYHERLLGQPRRQFSSDEARACVSDYRLAHCLINTLSAWYHWRPCNWSEVVGQMGDDAYDCLDKAGINSPVHLRLALFNYVNEHYAGFLETRARPEALQAFAASYQLGVPELEYLLVLDSDEEEVLTRDASQPSASGEVATLYNQWAFEAALFNASNVHFVIDCSAFERASGLEAQAVSSKATGTGAGAVIKRLCYLARLLGVYYDLSYDSRSSRLTPLLHLTLYGPQEMTGAPQQYGMRLARLCRLLLGYNVSQREYTKDGRNRQKKGAAGSRALASAIVEAEATIHFLQRSYRFVIDNKVLALLPPLETPGAESPSGGQVRQLAPVDTSTVFDSSIEQSLAEAFLALENSQAVDGWKLIREPEPLLLDTSIFIPDFALTRAGRRIYVEILGFWTSSYRERKIQKLHQLQGREDLVLAIPIEARDAFVSIAGMFPIVFYDGQLAVTALLGLLRRHYDDFAERLAAIDVTAVRERVESEGLLPERICYEDLRCYRRSELALAAEHVSRATGEEVKFVAGIGLFLVDWMEQLRIACVEWIGKSGKQALAVVLGEIRIRWPVLADFEDVALEAILGLWPEVHISRTSIFEATVEVGEHTFVVTQLIASNNNEQANNLPTKKLLREKRSVQKKRIVKEASQGDLWH